MDTRIDISVTLLCHSGTCGMLHDNFLIIALLSIDDYALLKSLMYICVKFS